MRPKLLILFFFFASSAAAQTIAIRAGHLVNPANGTVMEHQVIIIKDERSKKSALTSKSQATRS
jgi:hypothetical protein